MNGRQPTRMRVPKRVISMAMETLRSQCAPELPLLSQRHPQLPDAQLGIILGWSGELRSDDPWSAFALPDLPEVLRSLNLALLSSWMYSAAPVQGRHVPRDRVDLELTDVGGAFLLSQTRTAAFMVAMELHGAVGADMARQAEEALNGQLDEISAFIARQR